MIKILFVGDGDRDPATVPPLVERILGVQIKPDPRRWREIRVGGYRRKLLFAIRQAQDADARGLVATVDTDKDPKRQKIRELRKGRDEDRSRHPNFPVAIGEACPHAEVWLLDDHLAVRQGLFLARDAAVPNIRDVHSPKEALQELIRDCPRCEDSILEILSAVAKLVERPRCIHAKETGFHSFAEDVVHELRGLAPQS